MKRQNAKTAKSRRQMGRAKLRQKMVRAWLRQKMIRARPRYEKAVYVKMMYVVKSGNVCVYWSKK